MRPPSEKHFASKFVMLKVKAELVEEEITFDVDRMSFSMEVENRKTAVEFKLNKNTTKITSVGICSDKVDMIRMSLWKAGVGEGSLHLGFPEIVSCLTGRNIGDLIGKAAVKDFAI